MKKYIFCLLLIPMLMMEGLGFAQSIPNPVVLYSPDSINLSGKGDFGGLDSDQGKTFYYNLNVGDNYRFIARVNSHTGATARGKVIAFLKDVNPANETAGNRAMHFVSAELGQIAFYSRSVTNTRTRKLASVQVPGYPCWLYIEKKGDSVITKYSLSSANTPIASIAWASLGRYGNAFLGWANIKRGLGVASGSNSYSSANISKFSIQGTGGITPSTTIQGISDGQIIAYWNAYGSLRPVKARIFAGKLWVTDASNVLDNYFFVRGGNFLSRTDVALQNSFPASKIQYFEGITGLGGLVPPPAFTTPSGFRIGTNPAISADGTPYYEPINSLPNCAGNLFTILSATQQTGLARGEYIFDAINASKHRWNLYYGVTLIASDTVTATSSRIVFNIPSSVNSGNYTLKVDIQNCTATDLRAFSYTKPDGGVISAPTIASNPNPATVGSNIALTASNCSFTVDWFKNSTFQSSGQSFAVSNAVINDIYAAKCRSGANSSSFSNEVIIQDVATQGGTTGQTVFVNNLKTVPVETVNGKYSPQLFPTIATPLSNDPVLGKLYPNWAVAWQAEGGNFSRNNRTTINVGINFMYDRKPESNAGYGVRCLDYFWETNYSNGIAWADGIDPLCNKTINTFTSRIPFHERAIALHGIADQTNRQRWIDSDNSLIFDEGIEAVTGRMYGFGDRVNGKTNNGLANSDIEIGLEQGFEYYPKHLSFLLGLGSGSQGYVFSQYSAAINAVGADLSYYPSDAGVFPTLKKNPDGSNFLNGSGGTVVNNIPISPDWDPASKITISTRNITDKGVIDFPNVLPCIEISSTSDMTFHHGETYARKNGWAYSSGALSYSISNPIDNRIVDKFGSDRNTNHIIADIICYGDVNKWWSVNKLNGRKVFLQSKITCDRANLGLFHEAGFTNQSLKLKHYNREYGFDIGGFTALLGCEWQIWDRNTDQNLDGYHGAFGVINLMNQRKIFGSATESFTSLKPRLNFLLWNSEVSYDNGLNYVKDKATEYLLSENKLPQRQAVSSDGYWVIFAARPEGIEPTSAKFRVTYNGIVYYHTITANDWETTDYNQRNTALSSLPLTNKDYYYTIIKLGTGGTATESTTITPPTIVKNVASPTENQSVTFTSSGCQSSSYVTKWFDSVEGNLLSTGLTYTVNAVNGNGYYAKCVGATNSSIASNVITFSIASSTGVTIIEPAKTQYFYSNNQAPSFYASRVNLPAIITNTATFDEADVVKLKNSEVEFWFNLKRGGQICYASKASVPINRVYNGYDGGFQWVYDGAQYLVNGQLNGVSPDQTNNNINYNTTMGGDFQNNSQTLIDYHAVGTNGYYIKFRPILYNFIARFSEIEIEATYTLVGKSLKADYKYTSFRTDGNIEINNAFRFMGFHIPICFLTNNFTKYSVYTGNAPWTNGGMTEGDIPNITGGVNQSAGFGSTEFTGISFDPSNGFAVGVLNKIDNTNTQTSITYEQLNKYTGSSAGTVFTGPYTTMAVAESFAIPNGGNYVRSSSVYFTLGDSVTEVRNELKSKAGH